MAIIQILLIGGEGGKEAIFPPKGMIWIACDGCVCTDPWSGKLGICEDKTETCSVCCPCQDSSPDTSCYRTGTGEDAWS